MSCKICGKGIFEELKECPVCEMAFCDQHYPEGTIKIFIGDGQPKPDPIDLSKCPACEQ